MKCPACIISRPPQGDDHTPHTANSERLANKLPVLVTSMFLLASWLACPMFARAQLPPTITQAPTNQVLSPGGTLSLSVTASGDVPMAYQWFKDGRWLLGATNSTLTVTNAGMTNSGSYSVVVTNDSGVAISLPALVAVGNSTLVAWGYNVSGALVTGTTNNALLPLTVANNVVAAAGGWSQTLFVTADGTLWVVGGGSFGQLGNGTNIWTDVTVTNVASNVVAVAAGNATSFFITADGTLWGMGANSYGELGNGTFSNTNLPVIVASNVVAVTTGSWHTLFVKADGTLWAMGRNGEGELGCITSNWLNPTPVCVASNVAVASAGTYDSLFMKTDGTLWGMGGNLYGELGNGTTTQTNLPMSTASNVVAFAAGGDAFSLFVTSDTRLWAMGYNYYGQLGNGTSNNIYTTPINVTSNVVAVAAGYDHSRFVKSDGTPWAMGYNAMGQLGNGTTNDTHIPTPELHFLSIANICPGGLGHFSLALGMNSDATVYLTNLTQVYTGNAISATAVTIPPGLNVNLTYNGFTSVPTTPGSYTVVGTISDPNYTGSVTNTLVITYSGPDSPPAITSGPTNQTLATGGTITLNATAVGTPPPAYQWFKDSRRLPGATNSTLTVANAGVTNSGIYFVVVSNTMGTVCSLPAAVGIGNPSLLAWGLNNYGQLGNGTTRNTNLAITVASNVVTGAAGADHSLFVTADGKLWAMGYNLYGQLGNGTLNNTNNPINVASSALAVAAGNNHSLFVKSNGTLWAMGNNQYGQLGNGTTSTSNAIPINVANNVVAVAAGGYHSLFVRTNGILWAVGNNQYGQLGNGSTNNASLPVGVASDVFAAAAGNYHSLFVTMDGTLWGMGNNQYGQLGIGTTNNVSQPFSIASNIVAVAAGAWHSLFVTADGTLWSAGENNYGQLGNGTTNNASQPISVASNVVAVAAGNSSSFFVTADGTLWGMGRNNVGQLANGTTANTNLPIIVPHQTLANVFPEAEASDSLGIAVNYSATVTLGNLNQTCSGAAIYPTVNTTPPGLTVNLSYNGYPAAPTNWGTYTVIGTVSDPYYYGTVSNTLVITPAGPTNQMTALGGNVALTATACYSTALAYQWFKDGRLLVGATNSTLAITNATMLNSGTYSVMVTNGTARFISLPASVAVGAPALLAWGNNLSGQLGNGTTSNAMLPVTVAGNVVAGAAGANHSLFVTTDESLWAMGYNKYGQLGNGTTNDAHTPLSVASNVVAAAAGESHSLFVKNDGTLWAMGYNAYGQLGNGTTTDAQTPVSVANNVVAVAAGSLHSLFVKTDGTLWGMGNNLSGQLGNGTERNTNLPVCVASNVVAVAAGGGHSLFVKTDRSLWDMGFNFNGQLGNGTTTLAILPISVASNVVAVAAGENHSLFVTADGTLWTMGYNAYGQLGNDSTSNTNLPVSIASNVVAIAGGVNHSLFVTAGGTLWGMGNNSAGQLGNATTNDDNLPNNVPCVSVANIFPEDEASHSLAIGINSTPNGLNLTGGVPSLTFIGMAGASYNVARSTDLINWSVVWTTNEPGNGVFQFTDPSPPQPNAFYRLQPSP